MTQIEKISVVIPVNERGEGLVTVVKEYISGLSSTQYEFEYIIVLTPQYAHHADELEKVRLDTPGLKIIVLNRNYGEAGEIKIGVDHAQYNHILTLPAYEQVEPALLPRVVEALEDNDLVVVNRWPRIDPMANRIQSGLFRGLMKLLSYDVPKDAGCGVRLIRKEVFDDIKLYGDFHRFILILADQSGFRAKEIDLPQSKSDAHRRTYNIRTYLARALDILAVGFLSRFNKKPLRFFGTGGAISVFIGVVGLAYIAVERLFLDVPAGDRPLLVLFSLFLVLGIQLIAIGLVGETIIFTSSKNNKEYRIKKIIN